MRDQALALVLELSEGVHRIMSVESALSEPDYKLQPGPASRSQRKGNRAGRLSPPTIHHGKPQGSLEWDLAGILQ